MVRLDDTLCGGSKRETSVHGIVLIIKEASWYSYAFDKMPKDL